jgi:hypothetical protein
MPMPALAPALNPGGWSLAPEETGCVIEASGTAVLLEDVEDVDVEDTDVDINVMGLPGGGGGGIPDLPGGPPGGPPGPPGSLAASKGKRLLTFLNLQFRLFSQYCFGGKTHWHIIQLHTNLLPPDQSWMYNSSMCSF